MTAEERNISNGICGLNDHIDGEVIDNDYPIRVMEIILLHWALFTLIVLLVQLYQSWRDDYLKWSRKRQKLAFIRVDPNKVWVPDVGFFNSINNFEFLKEKSVIPVRINWMGTVTWNVPVLVTTKCTMNTSHFPFDTQTCTLVLGSWTLRNINMCPFQQAAWLLNAPKLVTEHPEWFLLHSQLYRDVHPIRGPRPFNISTIRLQFTFQRRAKYYEWAVIYPMCLNAFVSLFVFTLPNGCEEKVLFAVTMLLSLTFNLSALNQFVPYSSDSFPIIGFFFLACILLVALSVILNVIVLTINSSSGRPSRSLSVPSQIVQSWMFHLLAKLTISSDALRLITMRQRKGNPLRRSLRKMIALIRAKQLIKGRVRVPVAIVLLVHLYQSWRDDYLKWSRKRQKLAFIRVDPNKVWVPDVGFFNSINNFEFLKEKSVIPVRNLAYSGSFLQDDAPSGKIFLADSFYKINTHPSTTTKIATLQGNPTINWMGTVTWNVPVLVTTKCTMNTSHFPFDTQTCTLVLGSWTLRNINMCPFQQAAWLLNAPKLVTEHPEWFLLHSQLYRDVHPIGGPRPFNISTIRLQFTFQRRAKYYEWAVIYPMCLNAFVSLFVFTLPNGCEEKVLFAVTMLLSLTFNLSALNQFVPYSSDSFPIIGFFFLACILLVALSVILNVIVLTINSSPRASRSLSVPSQIVHSWMFHLLAKLTISSDALHLITMRQRKGNPLRRSLRKMIAIIRTKQIIKVRHQLNVESDSVNSPSTILSVKKICVRMTKVIEASMCECINRAEEERTREARRVEWNILANLLDRVFFLIFLCTSVSFACYFRSAVRINCFSHTK
ncbi:uncharacterized protein LOC142339740 [Convolutriloba macropyga]|uniref:uncharacterized protein LOC142339740 n=1 Tax=Convolutriloba macropyga TaxID=536237 RepID=UPI003F51AF2F